MKLASPVEARPLPSLVALISVRSSLSTVTPLSTFLKARKFLRTRLQNPYHHGWKCQRFTAHRLHSRPLSSSRRSSRAHRQSSHQSRKPLRDPGPARQFSIQSDFCADQQFDRPVCVLCRVVNLRMVHICTPMFDSMMKPQSKFT